MKVKIFMPKYMADFKCINTKCNDTCCAGWDINIDEKTYEKYLNSTGRFRKLLNGKFTENINEDDGFNRGFMILKDENRCPFLNLNMLCDIHGEFGEENLCITCKSYPRVYNIVDEVYEKSGLPSCEEVCTKALLNKEKMEFIDEEEIIYEDEVEIRRIIDSEAFEGTNSLIQYFWDIRVMSINIMQDRNFSIEERLNILKHFYNIIEEEKMKDNLDTIEKLLEDFNNELVEYYEIKGENFKEKDDFYYSIVEEGICKNIRSYKLKECVEEYKNGILNKENIDAYIYEKTNCFDEMKKYSYVFENYLVNQIFKDLIPFNNGGGLIKSIKILINSYRVIKAFVLGIALNSLERIDEYKIMRVIQALSKDFEHNKVFKNLLEEI